MRVATLGSAGAILALAAFLGPRAATPPPQDRSPELVASTEPRSPEDERRGFHLPEGFEAQLVAAEPDIHKPMNLAFDERGRLWITSTVEYPYPVKDGDVPRDAVKILEDFGPDGRARKITTFADGLNIPIGLLPLGDGRNALVHSIPHILKLTDDDGDGRADRREPLYATFGSKDTHGMTNSFSHGFDGWIYATHGFSNESEVRGREGPAITMQSGNTYRMKPDGSAIEYVTHGQVNPFGIAFDPRGNLFSADCHTRPVYHLLPGAWYPSFGKPHDGLGFGPEMVRHDHGSTGIAGIAYYAADHFPAPFRDSTYIGNVVTNRINRDSVEWTGASPKGIARPDFLTSEDPWFRPVDLELGPDGALYVADFYNRIIGHYEVPLDHPGRDRERGRIWRIVYKGTDGQAPPPADPGPDPGTATVEDWIGTLDHPNLAVRIRAAEQLVLRGEEVGPSVTRHIRDGAGVTAVVHGLWVLERLGLLADGGLLKAAAGHLEADVRVHAMRILAGRPGLPDNLRTLALDGLKDAEALVRRSAAEVLGRHPRPENLRPLLDLRHEVPDEDTHLRHVVRMALRDQLSGPEAWETLRAGDLPDEDARAIADVTTGVPGPRGAAFLLDHLRRRREGPANRIRYARHVARHAEPDRLDDLIQWAKADDPDDPAHPLAMVRAVREGLQERGAEAPESFRAWALEKGRAGLDSGRADLVLAAIEVARASKLDELTDLVGGLAARPGPAEMVRLSAVDAYAGLRPGSAHEVVGPVLASAEESIAVRERAAQALARLNRESARPALLEALPTAPARLQSAIAAGLAGSRDGAAALLDLVAAGKASARLLTERVVEVRLKASAPEGLEGRLAELTRGLPAVEGRLQARIERLRSAYVNEGAKADPVKGGEAFRARCSGCHQVGGEGGRAGPQLDGVGARGVDRLLEDLIDPNRNVDQAFRATTLALKDGQVLTGLLVRKEGEAWILADAQGKEQRIGADDVEMSAVTPLSPMPANLADQIDDSEWMHLLRFLMGRSPGP